MTRTLSIAISLLALFASTASATDASTTDRNASLRFAYEKVTLPGEEKMGLMGVTYLIELQPTWYFGPAAYGAVTGDRGGFYTIGGELAWRYPLTQQLQLETGAYLGGGGGSPYWVGGGLMWRPHIDLMWDFGGYRAGISASKVRFPNGAVDSNQIAFVIDLNTQFSHLALGKQGERVRSNARSGVGIDRSLGIVGFYQPRSGSTKVSGAPLTEKIGYVGTRMERMLSPYSYAGFEASGAFSGGVAGYAEFLGTMGAEMPLLNDHFKVGTRVALGMGGGVVDAGGGGMVKLGAYTTLQASRDFSLLLEGGLAKSIQGNFQAKYATLGLRWDLDHPYAQGGATDLVVNEWIGGVQHYRHAARKNGSVQSMDLVTLKLNRFVSESIYLSGQAHSAYAGDAGGYSVGLIGAGYRTLANQYGLYAGAEYMVGAGGGGDVNTSGGVVTQPLAYVGKDLSKSFSARLSYGQIKSMKGQLNTPVVELGLSYQFGTATRY